APLALLGDALGVLPGHIWMKRQKKIALSPQSEVVTRQSGEIREVFEGFDALPDQFRLIGIVELESVAAGRHGRRERAKQRTALDDDGLEAGPAGEESRRRADN